MSELIQVKRDNGIALVGINHPPVNALSLPVCKQLQQQMAELDADNEILGIVLYGLGRTFAAGADIRELKVIAETGGTFSDAMQRFIDAVEQTKKPIVVAMHGTVLGAGLELAMGCHWRIAASTTRFGQPEVDLGLIPGAAGTQRLPRLIGPLRAAEMCGLGEMINASKAEEWGIVDRIVECNSKEPEEFERELVGHGVAFIREIVEQQKPIRRTCDYDARICDPDTVSSSEGNAFLNQLLDQIETTRPAEYAPRAAIDAVLAAMSMNFVEGCNYELKRFDDCLRIGNAVALIHLFFAQREVPKRFYADRDGPTSKSRAEISRLLVIGKLSPEWITTIETARIEIARFEHIAALDWDNSSLEPNDVILLGSGLESNSVGEFLTRLREAAPDSFVASVVKSSARDSDHEFELAHLLIPELCDGNQSIEISSFSSLSNYQLAKAIELARIVRRVPVPAEDSTETVADRLLNATKAPILAMLGRGLRPQSIQQALREHAFRIDFDKVLGPDALEKYSDRKRPIKHPLGLLTSAEIVRPIRDMMLNEAVTISASQADSLSLDMAAVLGGAFPKTEGGPVWYLKRAGLDETLKRMRGYLAKSRKASESRVGESSLSELVGLLGESEGVSVSEPAWQRLLQDAGETGN